MHGHKRYVYPTFNQDKMLPKVDKFVLFSMIEQDNSKFYVQSIAYPLAWSNTDKLLTWQSKVLLNCTLSIARLWNVINMKNKISVFFVALILVVFVTGSVLVSPAHAQGEAGVPVKYFAADGSLVREDLANLGESVPQPPVAPEVPEQVFAYWYLVDDQLNGNPYEAYDFSRPVQDALNLCALYQPLPMPEETVAGKQPNVNTSETNLPEDTKSTEENGILLSETEVNTFLVRFYDHDGTLLHEVSGIKDYPVEKPEEDPQQEGQVFSHWYLVDEHLQGDALLPYNFEEAITGLTYLKAHYLPQQESQIPEYSNNETKPSRNIRQETVVQLSVALAVEGGEIEDGAYHALLSGANLPETGVVVTNEGEAFPFPELVFTDEDLGTHVFYIEALAEEPLPLHTYDLERYEIRVEVLMQQDGHITALVGYPQDADRLLITHSVQTKLPTVRVYTNLQPDQIINYGDEVVFTAELENCGDSPRLQWQYSPDNETWTDIAGGNGNTFSVLITPSNATGYWRVAVTITD